MKVETKSPRKDDDLFNFYWDLLIVEVKKRPNFSHSHVMQLKVLCDAYKQYDLLLDKVNEEGHVITRMTSQGESIITNPHVGQLNKVISQIKDYSKMLGLILVKDESPVTSEESEDDWL